MIIKQFEPKELFNSVKKGAYVGEGGEGTTLFLPDNTFIKMDCNLYNSIIDKKIYLLWKKWFLENYLKKSKYNVDRELVSTLFKLQPQIKLTKFDMGVIEVGGKVCGTLPYYHAGFLRLRETSIGDPITLIKIIRNILEAIHELEQNNIVYGDLNGFIDPNILIKDSDIQIIDFGSKRILISDNLIAKSKVYMEFRILLIKLRYFFIESAPELSQIIDGLLEYGDTDSYENANKTLSRSEKIILK